MKNFYNSFTFILTFMILVLIFQMIFGTKFVEVFLLLVLASMVVVNADKFSEVFKGFKEV